MNGSSPAKATISSKRSRISARESPSRIPLTWMFSRPVNSGWNPAPSSMRAETRPVTAIDPAVGFRIPPTSLSRVDLPEPFEPMMPIIRPRASSRLTSRTAHSSSPANRRPRPPRTNRSLTVKTSRPRWSRKRLETPRTATAMSGDGAATGRLHLLGQAVAEPLEDRVAAPEHDDRHHRHHGEVDPVRLPAEEDDVLVSLDQAGDRVQEIEGAEGDGQGVAEPQVDRDRRDGVEDGREEEEEHQAVGQDLLDVAEVNVERGQRQGQADGEQELECQEQRQERQHGGGADAEDEEEDEEERQG